MTMMNTIEAEIMEKGMNCLLQNLGPIDTARFISEIKRGKLEDYELMDIALERLNHYDPKKTIPEEQVWAVLGISEEELDAAGKMEFE